MDFVNERSKKRYFRLTMPTTSMQAIESIDILSIHPLVLYRSFG